MQNCVQKTRKKTIKEAIKYFIIIIFTPTVPAVLVYYHPQR
jgi:hypothetical protein